MRPVIVRRSPIIGQQGRCLRTIDHPPADVLAIWSSIAVDVAKVRVWCERRKSFGDSDHGFLPDFAKQEMAARRPGLGQGKATVEGRVRDEFGYRWASRQVRWRRRHPKDFRNPAYRQRSGLRGDVSVVERLGRR